MDRRIFLGIVASAAAPAAHTQGVAWPTRPIRVVVPFPPGGFSDILSRHLAERLQQPLGQAVVVENRSGAGGTIGADAVAKAPPDGHTLGISNIASHAVGPAVYRAVPYHPVRDFTHVALLGEAPLALAVFAGGPHRDLAGFLAAARARPGSLRVATPGNGTAAQVSLEMLLRLTGVEVVQVPFRGPVPAATETASGRLEATVSNAVEFAGNDRLRVIAIAAPNRMARLPDAPTFREQGVDLIAMIWLCLCGPAGLPAPIADRLHREVTAIVASPDSAALLERLGAVPYRPLSRAEVAAFVAVEAARWGEAARAAGVRAE